MVLYRDDEFRQNAQKWERKVDVDDSGRYKVACLNATTYRAYEGPLNGIWFWFEREEYYVLVGCTPCINQPRGIQDIVPYCPTQASFYHQIVTTYSYVSSSLHDTLSA